MPQHTIIEFGLLVLAGLFAGFVNVIAGGGSFLTLPLLLWIGLPAPVANASNRISLIAQNISAASTFQRAGRLPWKSTLLLFLPALPGAILGAEVATEIDETTFRRVLMAVLLLALWGLLRRPTHEDSPHAAHGPLLRALVFFAIGFYAGFLQVGLGLLLLTLLHSLGGFDLIASNAIKVSLVLLLQIVALAIFGLHGHVDWAAGAALAVGSSSGAWIGAHWQMRQGTIWVRRAVIVILVLFALRLGWEGFFG